MNLKFSNKKKLFKILEIYLKFMEIWREKFLSKKIFSSNRSESIKPNLKS